MPDSRDVGWLLANLLQLLTSAKRRTKAAATGCCDVVALMDGIVLGAVVVGGVVVVDVVETAWIQVIVVVAVVAVVVVVVPVAAIAGE